MLSCRKFRPIAAGWDGNLEATGDLAQAASADSKFLSERKSPVATISSRTVLAGLIEQLAAALGPPFLHNTMAWPQITFGEMRIPSVGAAVFRIQQRIFQNPRLSWLTPSA
jgi:hypothetical protein